MKKNFKLLFLILFTLVCFTLTSCGMFDGVFGGTNNNVEKIDDELTSSTGKWQLLDDDDTYFTFNGAKGVMTFSYCEDGVSKYNGTFRVVYKGLGKDVLTPLTFIFTRTDKQKEDWIGSYVEDFKNDFTQFTIMTQEEDLGMIDASIYTHIYRISELPYKMGSYVLEGKEYKQETNNYFGVNEPYVPSGTYSLESGESFYFLTEKPTGRELFQYRKGDVVIEGTYTMAQDKGTIYLYIEHDPYSKVTNVDKNKYDTTFDIYYPPDFYLRGDFSNSENITVNDLYHHTYSPTEIKDSSWVFGTYKKN